MFDFEKLGLADDSNEDRAEFVELLSKLAGTPKPNIPAPAELMPPNNNR